MTGQAVQTISVVNTLFYTRPAILHSNGPFEGSAAWKELERRLFESPAVEIGASSLVTVITANNGAPGMGLFERSLERMGVPVVVGGGPIEGWVNAIHKPLAILEALESVSTPFVLFADSRDCLMIRPPAEALREYYKCCAGLVFGAEVHSYPQIFNLTRYEDQLAPRDTEFRFLNSGTWIGSTDFARRFFLEVTKTAPLSDAPTSDQGIVRSLRRYYNPAMVTIDYYCRIFQNNVSSRAAHAWRVEP